MAEEAAPPTPAPAAMPHIVTAPSAPQPGITDGGQSALTPDRYWRLFTDPGLTPPIHVLQVVTTEAFLSLAHQLRHINERLDEVQKEVTKSKEEAAESSKNKSPFTPEIRDKPVLADFRLLILESYDGSSDPIEHVAAFRVQMALYDLSDALMELEQNFLANAQPKPTAASLLGITQGREEPLAQFINRFATESRAIPDTHPSLVIQAFLVGICPSKLFWSLVEKPPTIVPEMMQRANHFIVAEALIVGKPDEQKCPRVEQPWGPASGLPRRRIEGPDFSHPRPSTTPLNSMQTEIFLQIRGKGLLAPPNCIKTRPEKGTRADTIVSITNTATTLKSVGT
ncbi:hypothetical protein BHE74_00035871 [Ensete ventricosum]|nr:hypothetical protein BHE74_00035871 [Ensete ventricosum]